MATIENPELRGLGMALAEKETSAEIISQELGKLAERLLGPRDIKLLEVSPSKKYWLSYHVSRRDGGVYQVVHSQEPPILTRLDPDERLYKEAVEEIFDQLKQLFLKGYTLVDTEGCGWALCGGLKNERIEEVNWRAVRIEIAHSPAA